jgi:(p)ppGpp synthase/HD superfamily hydrolase
VIPQQVTGASPFLNELKKNVSSTLSRFADSHNFPLSGRVKTIESVGEKIEMGRYNRFSEIDDLVAFTLIIPTATYEQEVIDFCKASFDVVAV